jgi:hypothetical protein
MSTAKTRLVGSDQAELESQQSRKEVQLEEGLRDYSRDIITMLTTEQKWDEIVQHEPIRTISEQDCHKHSFSQRRAYKAVS